MMAGRVENVAATAQGQTRPALRPAGAGVLSEAEAYAHFDPVLASLLKQYRDAQAHYETLLRKNGAHDAMAEVAADMADSYDSAVETRILELRQQATIRRAAEAMMQESIDRMAASKRYHDKLAADARNSEAARDRTKREARESYMFVMFLWWMLQETLRETQRRLSAASAFARVTRHEDCEAAVA
jgi:hypothetical protein